MTSHKNFRIPEQTIKALSDGPKHFLQEDKPILGKELWSSFNKDFLIYHSDSLGKGFAFYQNIKLGEIDHIPLVLVINRRFESIVKKISCYGNSTFHNEEIMRTFYDFFVKCGIRQDLFAQKIILFAAHRTWQKGHLLLFKLSHQLSRLTREDSPWPEETTREVFQNRYFAGSIPKNLAEELHFRLMESRWKNKYGAEKLPWYFSSFGVITARKHMQYLKRKSMRENNRIPRKPSASESKGIDILSMALREFAPEIVAILDQQTITYAIIETNVLLCKTQLRYKIREICLSYKIFESDFSKALAIFLHEHSHIFGPDGSPEFTHALTNLLEAVIHNRSRLDNYEKEWVVVQNEISKIRSLKVRDTQPDITSLLTSKDECELREIIKRIPTKILANIL